MISYYFKIPHLDIIKYLKMNLYHKQCFIIKFRCLRCQVRDCLYFDIFSVFEKICNICRITPISDYGIFNVH